MGLFRKSVEEPLRPAQYTAFADGSMALEGEPRPEQFELREYGFVRGMAWFCLTASLLFEGALVVLAYTGEERRAVPGFSCWGASFFWVRCGLCRTPMSGGSAWTAA